MKKTKPKAEPCPVCVRVHSKDRCSRADCPNRKPQPSQHGMAGYESLHDGSFQWKPRFD